MIGLASLISFIAGIALMIIGIGLCASGAALPAGVTLIVVGGGLLAVSIPTLRYFNRKANLEREVKENKITIKVLKTFIQDPTFTDCVTKFYNELEIKHLPLHTFAVKYDLLRLHHLQKIYTEDRLQKPKKSDPQDPLYNDQTSRFNWIAYRIRITNQLLTEIEKELRVINQILRKSSVKKARVQELNERKLVLFERANQFLDVRTKIFKDVPSAMKISTFAFDRYWQIEKLSERPFYLY